MTDHDDLLNEIGTALKPEPSRDFADGVRARIRKSQLRTTQMWWGLAAAATVTLAVMTLWRPASEAPTQVAAAQVTAVQAPVSDPGQLSNGGRVSDEGRVSNGGRVSRRGNAAVVRVAATTDSEPPLEVITNQGEVLRQLWADVRGSTLVMAEASQAVEDLSPKPIEVNPIEVRPIVVSEIGPPPGERWSNPCDSSR
jgi:hypothetical protein